MGQAKSDQRLTRRRKFAACVCFILTSATSGSLLPSESCFGFTSTPSSGFQETRPRRVNPPAVDGRVSPHPGKTEDPGPAQPVLTAKARAVRPLPTVAPAHSFTVQVGAFLNRENARRLAGLLESKGYNPDVSTKTDGQKRVWHLVRVGSHPDRAHASAAASEIEKKLKIKAIVRPAKSL